MRSTSGATPAERVKMERGIFEDVNSRRERCLERLYNLIDCFCTCISHPGIVLRRRLFVINYTQAIRSPTIGIGQETMMKRGTTPCKGSCTCNSCPVSSPRLTKEAQKGTILDRPSLVKVCAKPNQTTHQRTPFPPIHFFSGNGSSKIPSTSNRLLASSSAHVWILFPLSAPSPPLKEKKKKTHEVSGLNAYATANTPSDP